MQALITRPIEDAGELAAALSLRGVTPLGEPLLTIRPVADPQMTLSGVQAVLFTSANGARAFARATARRDLAVIAVGDATARTARALGFADIASAGGDVGDLAALVAARLDPRRGALLHAAGSVVAGDLAARLRAAGFEIRRSVLYHAEPVAALSEAAVDALHRGNISAAFFFSPRTAAHFVTLATAASVGEACRYVAAFSLSPAVAAQLSPLTWARIAVAAAPVQDSLLTAFDGFLAGADAGEGRMPE